MEKAVRRRPKPQLQAVNGTTVPSTAGLELAARPTTHRIDAVVVRPIVTLYDADGRPLGELLGDELKIFRASNADIWAALDKAVRLEERP